jgi:hypothetical protein
MKVSFRASKKFTVEADAEDHKAVFAQLAALSEVFSVNACGNCKSEDIVPVVRNSKDKKGKVFKYYELRCRKCNARFAFGQHNEGGTLFPQRKDPETQEYKPNDGWVVFKKEEDE